MARSRSTVPTADEYRFEYTESDEEAQLVVRTDKVTVTIDGEPEAVHRQFREQQAAALDLSPEELDAVIRGLPMPELDDLESVPPPESSGE